MDRDLIEHRLRQRDYVLRIARAMSAQLNPKAVLALVIRSAVTMTGGQGGAIVIRRGSLPNDGREEGSGDGTATGTREVDIVASYHLEDRMAEYVQAMSGKPRVTPTVQQVAEPFPARYADNVAGDGASATGGSTSRATAELRESAGRDGNSSGTAAPLLRLSPVLTQEPHQVLTLPLRFSGEEIGRIVVFRNEGAAYFTPVDEDLLRSFADLAAVAIGNALLHERLARSRGRLRTVVERSPAGILLLDANGRIDSANASIEKLSGRSRQALNGLDLEEALPLLDERDQRVRITLPTNTDESSLHRGLLHSPAGADGNTSGPWVQLSVTPLVSSDGNRLDGHVAVVTDVTAWREAERAKTAFLAGLSHELKTPLSLIRGFAETLGAPEMEHDLNFHGQAVQVILDETEHLTSMVDQLLLAARASAGSLQLELHPIDLGRLVSERVEQFQRARPRHVWVDLAEGSLPTLIADPTRLREVLDNLLDNAAKYAPEGTPINVSVETDAAGENLILRVSDLGVGIDVDDVPRVFERFWRADEAIEGTGLGLYMARAVVEAHGGSIAVEHSTLGAGTTMRVTLPRVPPGSGQIAMTDTMPHDSASAD